MNNRLISVPTIGALALTSALTLSACGRSHVADPPSSQPKGGGQPVLIATGNGVGGNVAPGLSTITTEGVGTVTGAPDTATVGIAVSTSAPHAAAALAHNNSVAAAVQRALQSDGVATADIQTTGLSLQQTYPPSPAGYQVYDEVTATLRNLALAGTVIDNAVAAAGDAGRLNEVNLSMADTDPLMAAARSQAVNSAKLQAEQLAAAAEAHLGTLVSLTDQAAPQPYPMYAGSAGASAAGGGSPPVPLQAGTQQLTVDVTAVWRVTN
jgi:hypothetical protein